jgi:hypothetical protein
MTTPDDARWVDGALESGADDDGASPAPVDGWSDEPQPGDGDERASQQGADQG